MDDLTTPPEIVRLIIEHADDNGDVKLICDVGSQRIRNIALPVKLKHLVIDPNAFEAADAIEKCLPIIANSVKSIAFCGVLVTPQHLAILDWFPRVTTIAFIKSCFDAASLVENGPVPQMHIDLVVFHHMSGSFTDFVQPFLDKYASCACVNITSPGKPFEMSPTSLRQLRLVASECLRFCNAMAATGQAHVCHHTDFAGRSRHISMSGNAAFIQSSTTVLDSKHVFTYVYITNITKSLAAGEPSGGDATGSVLQKYRRAIGIIIANNGEPPFAATCLSSCSNSEVGLSLLAMTDLRMITMRVQYPTTCHIITVLATAAAAAPLRTVALVFPVRFLESMPDSDWIALDCTLGARKLMPCLHIGVLLASTSSEERKVEAGKEDWAKAVKIRELLKEVSVKSEVRFTRHGCGNGFMESPNTPPEMVCEIVEFAAVNGDAKLLCDVGSSYIRSIALPVKFRTLIVTAHSLLNLDALLAIHDHIRSTVETIALCGLNIDRSQVALISSFPQVRHLIFVKTRFPTETVDNLLSFKLPSVENISVYAPAGDVVAFLRALVHIVCPHACLAMTGPGPAPLPTRRGMLHIKALASSMIRLASDGAFIMLGQGHSCSQARGQKEGRHFTYTGKADSLGLMLHLLGAASCGFTTVQGTTQDDSTQNRRMLQVHQFFGRWVHDGLTGISLIHIAKLNLSCFGQLRFLTLRRDLTTMYELTFTVHSIPLHCPLEWITLVQPLPRMEEVFYPDESRDWHVLALSLTRLPVLPYLRLCFLVQPDELLYLPAGEATPLARVVHPFWSERPVDLSTDPDMMRIAENLGAYRTANKLQIEYVVPLKEQSCDALLAIDACTSWSAPVEGDPTVKYRNAYRSQQNQACTWTGTPKSSVSRAAPGTRRGPKIARRQSSVSSNPPFSQNLQNFLSPTAMSDASSTSSSESVSTELLPIMSRAEVESLEHISISEGPPQAYPLMYAVLSDVGGFWRGMAEAVGQGAESTFQPSGFPPLGKDFNDLMQYRDSLDEVRKTTMSSLMSDAYRLGRVISDIEFYDAVVQKLVVANGEKEKVERMRRNLTQREENIKWLHGEGFDNISDIVLG
ncbi:hypothetical protein C8J56DRAFT_1042003 [Mycena floridula]|nr:hypothetical protein C8J56DRAFT_1042003 [Mycena floridula]